MKLLITGATGFIAQELVRRLQNSYEIITLVRETSDTTTLETMKCEIIKLHDHKEIINIFSHNTFTGVIHVASNVVVEHNNTDIEPLINSNITFGTYLLEACKQTKVKWFINTGTFWQNYQNEDYNPVNLYAATKEAFETVAKYYTQTSELIFTTIKLNDTFGPNDTRAKIFNLWDNIAKSGETLAMSQGEQFIDISYIDDVIESYALLITHLNSDNATTFRDKTFVVSNKEILTLKELSTLFEESTQSKLNIDWGGRAYRQREVMRPYSLGKGVPGWEQKYKLKDSIKQTLMEK